MGDVGQRVLELGLGERALGPIGEAAALVGPHLRQLRDQRLVAHLVAEAGDHCRDLGVEQRDRRDAALVMEYLDVLFGRVHHLEHVFIRDQVAERREIDAVGERIDDRLVFRARDLHQAQDRPEGALAHELGIDGDIVGGGQPVAKGGEGVRVGNHVHGRRFYRDSRGAESAAAA